MTRGMTLAGYAVIVAAMVLYEVRQRVRGGATFTDALDAVVRVRLGKWFLLAAWLWWGWHVFVRVDRG
jgi:hypothetical protein